MRASRLVVAGLVFVAFAAAAAAQEQHLGEVASSVALERPDGEAVVITDSDFPPPPPTPAQKPYSEELTAALVRYREAVGSLEAVLEKANGTRMLYSAAWQRQVDEACRTVESVGIDLGSLAPAAQYADARSAAERAVKEYEAALAVVRDAATNRTATFANRYPHLAAGREAMEQAVASALASEQRLVLEQPAKPIVPAEALEDAAGYCGTFYDEDSEIYGHCRRVQQAAIMAMAERSAYSLAMSDEAFNTLRNRCLNLHGPDFDRRNDCEVAALAGR